MTEAGQDRARQRVHQELARRQWNPSDLQRAAGVDPGTIGDFLSGKRWPRPKTRSRIAQALEWVPEGLDELASGDEPTPATGWGSTAGPEETVSDQPQDAGVLLDLPPEALEGLGRAEREEVITAAKLSALAKAREIRRRLDE